MNSAVRTSCVMLETAAVWVSVVLCPRFCAKSWCTVVVTLLGTPFWTDERVTEYSTLVRLGRRNGVSGSGATTDSLPRNFCMVAVLRRMKAAPPISAEEQQHDDELLAALLVLLLRLPFRLRRRAIFALVRHQHFLKAWRPDCWCRGPVGREQTAAMTVAAWPGEGEPSLRRLEWGSPASAEVEGAAGSTRPWAVRSAAAKGVQIGRPP